MRTPDRSASIGEPEARFYRDLAGRTGVRTFRSVYADVDPSTRHGVVITEDVVAQGAVFLEPGSDYPPDKVAESLEQFAVLHAATWSASNTETSGSMASPLPMIASGRGVDVIERNFDGPIGRLVPTEVRDAERLHRLYPDLVAMAEATSTCVVHGDAHVGNVFLDGAGRPGLLDWQLVHRGPWYLDVGYHIASTMTVADRRAREHDLLRHYLDRLSAGGVDAPTFDEALSAIRYGILHGFYLWAITVQVDPSITTALLERLGNAAADHGALDSVGDDPMP